MEASAKRKNPSSNGPDNRQLKRSKGGSGGRWQTPHHKSKLETLRGKNLEIGDMGIWITCVKGKERQALGEMMDICSEYGEKLYGIKPEGPADVADDEDDIEASIKKEVEGMKPAARPKDATFEPMRMDLDCVGFVRTRSPVDPVELVHRICKDASEITDKTQRRSRFINRFTPVTLTVKANETGVEEVAKKILSSHFQLAGNDDAKVVADGSDVCSYAIRPSFRAHNNLKRGDVIDKVASFISSPHKVNLTSPDKVILIDIYQMYCGMSVVDGDWEALKRYNLHEIYLAALKATRKDTKEAPEEPKGEANPPAANPEA